MTTNVKLLFRSDAEAMAFVAGINYIIDPAVKIDCVGYDKKSNSWYVKLFDRDSYPYEKEWIYDLTDPKNLLFSFGETEDEDVDF